MRGALMYAPGDVRVENREDSTILERNEQDMKSTRSGGETGRGPAEWFTGDVLIDTIRNPDDQSAIGCAHARFSPSARTAWHSHPKGQTLYVTDGIGSHVADRAVL